MLTTPTNFHAGWWWTQKWRILEQECSATGLHFTQVFFPFPPSSHLAAHRWRCSGCSAVWSPGVVTTNVPSELPTYNEWLESSLVRFLAHDLLDGPRQRRAFWADSASCVDTGRLIFIRGNYQGTRLKSGEKAGIVSKLVQIIALSRHTAHKVVFVLDLDTGRLPKSISAWPHKYY